jgi:hypothetical protein
MIEVKTEAVLAVQEFAVAGDSRVAELLALDTNPYQDPIARSVEQVLSLEYRTIVDEQRSSIPKMASRQKARRKNAAGHPGT